MLASGGVGGGRLWAAMPAGRTAVVAAATVATAAGRGGGRLGPASRISGSVVMTGQFGVSVRCTAPQLSVRPRKSRHPTFVVYRRRS